MTDIEILKLLKNSFPDTPDFLSNWEYQEASFQSTFGNIHVGRYSVKLDKRCTEETRYGRSPAVWEHYVELHYRANWSSDIVLLTGDYKATEEEAITAFKQRLGELKLFIDYLCS